MRISLGGWSFEIGELSAFDEPDPNTDVISLFLEDGVPFEKAAYVDLNYRRFEVWCVGAAGGRGGNVPDGFTNPYTTGGGGGGGGLQRVAGMLASLPDSVDVSIGVAGEDGSDGNNEWPEQLVLDGEGEVIHPATSEANPDYVAPIAGTDGGTTSFGDICKASGGKGGGVPPVTIHGPVELGVYGEPGYLGVSFYAWWAVGPGGDGGKGGQLAAGDGGIGGYVFFFSPTGELPSSSGFTYVKAEDGKWNGSIGTGGGGGYGGPGPQVGQKHQAGDGGRGSYSYRDPSIFGPKQKGEEFTIGEPALAGSGGGARLNPLDQHHLGSKAPGANPNGGVFIRIYDIEEDV